MPFGDVSQAVLRGRDGMEPGQVTSDPIGVVAGVFLLNPSADTIHITPPVDAPFSMDDIKKMGAAIYTQGNYFLGIDVTSRENAMKCARDLLALLFIMKYAVPVAAANGPIRPTWNTSGSNWPWDDLGPPPLPPATSAVAGSPGKWLPDPSIPPYGLENMISFPAPNPIAAWKQNEYVVLGDGSKATWLGIGMNSTVWAWNLPWNKANAIPNMCFPAEPTVFGQDQANADKLVGLGFVIPGVAWASWDYIVVGNWMFTQNGTKWLPA